MNTNKTEDYFPDKPEKIDTLGSLFIPIPTITVLAFFLAGIAFVLTGDTNGAKAFFIISFVAAIITMILSFFVFFRSKTKKTKTVLCFLIVGIVMSIILNFYSEFLQPLYFWEFYENL